MCSLFLPGGKELFKVFAVAFGDKTGDEDHFGRFGECFEHFSRVGAELFAESHHMDTVNTGTGNEFAQNRNDLDIHGHTACQFDHHLFVDHQPAALMLKGKIKEIKSLFCRSRVEPFFMGIGGGKRKFFQILKGDAPLFFELSASSFKRSDFAAGDGFGFDADIVEQNFSRFFGGTGHRKHDHGTAFRGKDFFLDLLPLKTLFGAEQKF